MIEMPMRKDDFKILQSITLSENFSPIQKRMIFPCQAAKSSALFMGKSQNTP
jgi:hypothetical protein